MTEMTFTPNVGSEHITPEELERQWRSHANAIRERLMKLPGEIAAGFSEEKRAAAEAMCREEIEEALSELEWPGIEALHAATQDKVAAP
jgi:hypothetical protein